MKQSKILYEPLPVGRIGFVKSSKEVIAVHDYSCFARMIEEYISFGATKICLPKASPELKSIAQMPPMLEKRVEIFDDTNEMESTLRLLHKVGKEFGVRLSDDGYHLGFNVKMSRDEARAVKHVYELVKKLAVGFNHKFQVDINPGVSIRHIRVLRDVVRDTNSRLILAQIEALLGLYEDVEFCAPKLKKASTPSEIISVYDRLINDRCFLDYSEAMFEVADPSYRQRALIWIKDIEQRFKESQLLATGWNYSARVLSLFNQIKLPEFRELSLVLSTLVNGRSLPALINLEVARGNAIDQWKRSELVERPLSRSGAAIADEDVIWMPPSISPDFYSSSEKPVSFGSAERLMKELNKALDRMEAHEAGACRIESKGE